MAVGSAAAVVLLVPGTLEVHGSVWLFDDSLKGGSQTWCTGTGGYSDVTAGAQISVLDPDGTVLAFAPLGPGNHATPASCEFGFSVKLPAGKGIYGFQLGRRGVVRFNEDHLDLVELSIGTI